MLKIVHYINQFFANVGGEEMAHIPAEIREGIVGPGLAFSQAFKDEAEIVATVVCGDSYFNENMDKDEEKLKLDAESIIRAYDPCMSCATNFLKIDWILAYVY